MRLSDIGTAVSPVPALLLQMSVDPDSCRVTIGAGCCSGSRTGEYVSHAAGEVLSGPVVCAVRIGAAKRAAF